MPRWKKSSKKERLSKERKQIFNGNPLRKFTSRESCKIDKDNDDVVGTPKAVREVSENWRTALISGHSGLGQNNALGQIESKYYDLCRTVFAVDDKRSCGADMWKLENQVELTTPPECSPKH